MADRFTFSLGFNKPAPRRTIQIPEEPDETEVEAPDADDPLWREVDHDEDKSLHWRGHVGTFVARELGKEISKAWHIEQLPPGYSFWEKSSLSATNPHRKDYYLYGYGGKARFSSPQEFSFHAVWLYGHALDPNLECQCTLCTGRSQGDINSEWFNNRPTKSPKARRLHSPIRDVGMPLPRRVVNTDRWFRWTASKGGLLSPGRGSLPQTVIPERNADLKNMQPFRTGELVWISLPDPLTPTPRPLPSGNEVIEFWPGLVREHHVQHHVSDNGSLILSESRAYTVDLLAVGSRHVLDEEKILSWQCFRLPLVVRNRLGKAPMPVEVTANLTELEDFYPIPPQVTSSMDIPRTFNNALGPLRIACSQARRIEEQYTLTDPYDEDDAKLYRGAWWGPERIWTHDFVRLAYDRDELVQRGVQEPLLPSSEGAKDRSLFVHIAEMFYENDFPTVSGRLYELTETDPEDSDSDVEMQDRTPSTPSRSKRTTSSKLPKPPAGFTFKPLTSSDMQITLPFQRIAGRYDPLPRESDAHVALLSRILNVTNLTAYNEERYVPKELKNALKRILSIVGLAPGSFNWIPASRFVQSRQDGIRDAARVAKKEYWDQRRWGIRRDRRPSPSGVRESLDDADSDVITID